MPQPVRPSHKDTAAKLKEKVRAPGRSTPRMTLEDLRGSRRSLAGLLAQDEAEQHMRDALLEYYRSPEGQEDIADAPLWLRSRPVEEIVELLMKDVSTWNDSGYPAHDPRGRLRP